MPYLHGRWKVNFRYAEISGNQGRMSGCQGVWPYIYSIEYFVYQYPGSTEYVLCRDGDDCVENKNPPKRLQQAAFEVLEKNCALRDHGLADSGLNLFLMNDYRRRATGGEGNGAEPLDESWFTHNAEFEKMYGRPTDEQGKPFNSSTWSRWKVPGQKRVNTIGMSNQQKLQVRKNATLMPWGRICDQFDWPDVEELGPGFASPFYKGAMRHENMTWIWIKSLETCRCFPRCKDCYFYNEGVSPQFQNINETCIQQFGDDIHEDCDFKIVGVGGGPVVYPPATTGRPLDYDGIPEMCYQYTLIDGHRSLAADKVPMPPGIQLTEMSGAARLRARGEFAWAILVVASACLFLSSSDRP